MIRRQLYSGKYRVEPAGVSVSANRPYYTVGVADLFRLKTKGVRVRRLSSRANRTNGESENAGSRGRQNNTSPGSSAPHYERDAK